MNLELVEKIAKAVLYEGYMLYPYRASAVKNRQRWNFGAVYPAAFSKESNGTDACMMQTQCLLIGGGHSTIDVNVRFLHLRARDVYEVIGEGGTRREDGGLRMEERGSESPSSILNPPHSIRRIVDSLEAGGRIFQTWQEAVERRAGANSLAVSDLCARPERISFSFAGSRETEPIRDESGKTAGVIVREQQSIQGEIEVSSERLQDQLFRITARITNITGMGDGDSKSREEALMRSFVSTHTVLGLHGGEFVSLLDPPDDLRDSVAACGSVGAFPVLVGEQGERDLMLSSPIILYDYPQIAPESAGELFDSTEIDEILTLRILTLTDEEKREMRNIDAHARRILERTETLPLEQLMKLHGAVRGLRPVDKNAG
jgi:hydrogenase maturation protease